MNIPVLSLNFGPYQPFLFSKELYMNLPRIKKIKELKLKKRNARNHWKPYNFSHELLRRLHMATISSSEPALDVNDLYP